MLLLDQLQSLCWGLLLSAKAFSALCSGIIFCPQPQDRMNKSSSWLGHTAMYLGDVCMFCMDWGG